MLQSLCLQYFFAFIVHCCVVPLTSVTPTTYPPPSTQRMHGCATTVGWLLIMTTVGKTHAVKYIHQRSNTDYTYTLLNNCLKTEWGLAK